MVPRTACVGARSARRTRRTQRDPVRVLIWVVGTPHRSDRCGRDRKRSDAASRARETSAFLPLQVDIPNPALPGADTRIVGRLPTGCQCGPRSRPLRQADRRAALDIGHGAGTVLLRHKLEVRPGDVVVTAFLAEPTLFVDVQPEPVLAVGQIRDVDALAGKAEVVAGRSTRRTRPMPIADPPACRRRVGSRRDSAPRRRGTGGCRSSRTRPSRLRRPYEAWEARRSRPKGARRPTAMRSTCQWLCPSPPQTSWAGVRRPSRRSSSTERPGRRSSREGCASREGRSRRHRC